MPFTKSLCRIFEQAGRGFILVTVLLISALFLSTAAAYAAFAVREMRRAASEEFAASSRALAVIACREAGEWIASDTGESDSKHEPLYSGSPIKLNYGDYSVYVTITPLDDKIPINGLLLPDGTTMKNEYAYPWSRAWDSLGFKNPPPVLDFIDTDREARQNAREEDYFPNRRLSDLSELMRLPEIDRGNLYAGVSADAAIDSYFTVYGKDGININMTPVHIIGILDPGVGPDVAEAAAAYRLENAVGSASDLEKIAGFPKSAITRLKNVINYKSNFFLVAMRVERGASSRRFEATLERGDAVKIVNWRE